MYMSTTTETPRSEQLPGGLDKPLPAPVKEAINGGEMTLGTEHSVIHWLLQPQQAPRYDVPVKFETPEGTLELTFRLRSIAGDKLDGIERQYMNEDPTKVDDMGLAAALIAASTEYVMDPKTGTRLELSDPKFVLGIGSVAEAIRARFHFQSGVLVNLANEVRRVSGWSPDRVGRASRVLVDLTGKA
jgi:hypothetical protein